MIRKPAPWLICLRFFRTGRTNRSGQAALKEFSGNAIRCSIISALILGIAEGHWTIGALIEAAFDAAPPLPTPTAPIGGGNSGE